MAAKIGSNRPVIIAEPLLVFVLDGAVLEAFGSVIRTTRRESSWREHLRRRKRIMEAMHLAIVPALIKTVFGWSQGGVEHEEH